MREVLFRMERAGVLVDAALLGQQSRELGERVLELERQAFALAGQPFNLASPKQLGEILFERMKLPVVKKTATGQPSTDEEVLQELAADYPLPKLLLQHRSLAKLKSTYTDKLPQMVNPRTGRVHTTYAQATAVTGRLASSDPNLQNIPVRTAEGRRIREAFIAPPGHRAGLGRLLADRAADHGAPVRRPGAAEGVRRGCRHPPRDGGGDLRRARRRRDHRPAPLHQGGELRAHLRHGRVRPGAAARHRARRRAAVHRQVLRAVIPAWPPTCSARASSRASRATSRRCSGAASGCPTSRRPADRGAPGAERAAINAPMQGTAADLIKLAMIAVQRLARSRAPCRAKLILQVHDELVLEVPDGEVDARQARTARADGRGGAARGAAGRRRGLRRQLGRGALSLPWSAAADAVANAGCTLPVNRRASLPNEVRRSSRRPIPRAPGPTPASRGRGESSPAARRPVPAGCRRGRERR